MVMMIVTGSFFHMRVFCVKLVYSNKVFAQ
jgi:hypothetical protein